MIVKRDIKILQMINLFRFTTIKHIAKALFDLDETHQNARAARRTGASRRLRMLCKYGYIAKQKTHVTRLGIYTLTQKGIDELKKHDNNVCPAVKKVPAATLEHDFYVQNVAISLMLKGWKGIFTDATARSKSIFSKKYIADIYAKNVNDEGYTAFEIELSFKKSKRIEDKLKYYNRCESVESIVYISTNNKVLDSVRRIYERLDLEAVDVRFQSIEPIQLECSA